MRLVQPMNDVREEYAKGIRRSGAMSPAIVGIVLLALLVPGDAARSDPSPYAPGPGDVLEVQVYAGGARQESFTATVSTARTITCPLLGDVPIGAGTVTDLRARLAQAYGNGFYVKPEVLLNVTHYAGSVLVTGEVRHPGLYPLQQGLTLLGACELAGGLTDYASAHRVRVIRARGDSAQRIEVDLARIQHGKVPDLVLERDDRIEIPQRWF